MSSTSLPSIQISSTSLPSMKTDGAPDGGMNTAHVVWSCTFGVGLRVDVLPGGSGCATTGGIGETDVERRGRAGARLAMDVSPGGSAAATGCPGDTELPRRGFGRAGFAVDVWPGGNGRGCSTETALERPRFGRGG